MRVSVVVITLMVASLLGCYTSFDRDRDLLIAVNNSSVDSVNILLKRGANPNGWVAFPPEGIRPNSPLYRASELGSIQIVQLMLDAGADLESSALIVSSKNGHLDVVRLLLEKGADTGYERALGFAARNGHTEVVRLLLERGADVNYQEDQDTSIMGGARRTSWVGGRLDTLCMTPLGYAVQGGHAAVVQLLLEKGAHVDGRYPYFFTVLPGGYSPCQPIGGTALLASVRERQILGGADLPVSIRVEQKVIAGILLKNGANPNAHASNERTALCHAVENADSEMVSLLLDAGAGVTDHYNYDPTDFIGLEYLGDYKILHERLPRFSGTILQLAARFANGGITATLINHGAR